MPRLPSQLKPRMASVTPSADQAAITPSAVTWLPIPVPVTIAPESPSITGLSGSAWAIPLRKPGAVRGVVEHARR